MLQRLAQADGNGQSLLAFVGGLDQRDAGKRRFDRARRLRGAPARPEIGGVGRTKRLRGEGVARGKRATRGLERDNIRAQESDGLDQALEKGLRMGRAGLVLALDRGERILIQMEVQPRQDQCALSGPRDRRQQPRRDDVRSGRADGDDRIAFTRNAFDRALDQRLLPARRIDEAALLLDARPGILIAISRNFSVIRQ